MDDDDLLRRLAETAREEEQEGPDPRWDALSAGTLPEAEAASLRSEAGESAAGRRTLEAFAPLDDDFRSRVADSLRAHLPSAPEGTAKARPIPFSSRGRRWWLSGAAVAAALAATLLLVLLQPWRQPLPPYSADLKGGTRELRGEATEPRRPPVFATGNTFDLVLTPERAVAGRPSVVMFLAHDGEMTPWQAPVEVSKSGAVRIAGQVGEEIRLPAGTWTLFVAVGRRGSLPTAAELRDHLADLPTGEGGPGCRPLRRDASVCAFRLTFQETA